MIALQEVARTAAEVRLPLWGRLSLADPLFLLLLPLVLLAVWQGARRRRRVAARVPLLPVAPPPRSLVQRLAWLPPTMKAVALLLAVLALARPLRGSVEVASRGEGVDIALLLDRSSSMDSQAEPGGPTRLDVAKDVIGEFALRRMTDTEGIADNVALFTFASYTDLLCPFTLDADALLGALRDVDFAEGPLDGTSIGVAISKAVEVYRDLDAESKVAILLTDGIEKNHVIEPVHAGKLAAEEGVKVYTIFVGPRVTYQRTRTGFAKVEVEVQDLAHVAEMTGAKHYHAETPEELEEVYAEIESLERRFRDEQRYAERFDLYPRLLLPAAVLYALAWLSLCTWARRLP